MDPPPVVFRAGVSLVQIDVVVTDGDGRIIRDLREGDFQVFEDGKQQRIDRVAFVEIPVTRTAGAPRPDLAAQDVRTNLHSFDGRLYVLLLDDLHTAPGRSERVRQAARQFVSKHLEHADLAAIAHVSGAGGASQDFTSDRELLLASIDRFSGRKLPSETLSRLDEYNRQRLFRGRPSEKTVDRDEAARAHDARTVFATVAAIAKRLRTVTGRRKALLWFGEGVSYDMFDLASAHVSPVLENWRGAAVEAGRANLAIYAVDARGLSGLGDEAIQLSQVPDDPTSKLDSAGLNAELLRSQDNLRRVAHETGGFAVVNTGDLARAYARVVEESSAYYLLGYQPAGERGGTFQRLDVRVNRAGARVRARGGYVASAKNEQAGASEAESPAGVLSQTLASPVPQGGLPMAIHVVAFAGRGDKHSVLATVEYGASTFASAERAGAPERLDISVIALNSTGTVAASDHSTIGLEAKPNTRGAMAVRGFRTHTRLALGPGRYQIRAAAAASTGRVGSVHTDVEVPDFAAQPFAVTALALTSMVAGYTPTARLDERLRDVLPAPPTATRDFRNDEAIAFFAEVYESGRTPEHDVKFRTQIRDRAGRIVFTREDVRSTEQMQRSNGGYWLQLSLRQFVPGGYVVRFEAEPRKGIAVAAREVAFHVWEAAAKLPDVPQQ